MKPRSLWLFPLLMLACQTASAELGLPQVRHALFLDRNAPVEADLRRLAERGDRPSMHLLGNTLANDPRTSLQAFELYRQAFAEGAGEIRALSSMSRLLDRMPSQQAAHEAFMRSALAAFPHERDPYTLETALETFLVYPQLFQPQQTERLLRLFQRSCLENCSSDLYRAVQAERLGNRAEAQRWYESALRIDERALERYYQFLGEERDRLFVEFSQRLEAEQDLLAVEIRYSIGSLLERIAADQNELALEPLQNTRTQRALTPQEVQQEQALQERYQASRQAAQRWIDAAVAQDYPPALINRINYMLRWPKEHQNTQVTPLISRLESLDPMRAKALRSQLHLVNGWPSLDPQAAHQMIQELIADGYPDGELLLAGLYVRGSLDQPDMARALPILQRLAQSGSAAANYRLAMIYSEGQGMCRDLPKSFAYATLAQHNAEPRADSLLRRLALVMDDQQREDARVFLQQLPARSQP